MNIKIKNNRGFSLMEIIIVIAILVALMAIVIPNFFSISKNTDLNNSVTEFVTILKLAQNKALSSDGNSQYGVYLDTVSSPNKYILFKGSSYASNAVQSYSLPATMEFYNINLGGGNQIVFDRLTGASENSGNVLIRIKADITKNKTIYITSAGTTSFTIPLDVLDTNRVKDSRHMQFAYSRVITTTTENIVLTFDNNQTETIPIISNMVGSELQWTGTVSVGGVNQVVEINTYRLNSPDTLFSVHRDKRYNTKSLKITISGDTSGYLIQYSADGTSVDHTSTYASNFDPI